MQLKNLAVFLLSATALATVEKRDQMDDTIKEALEDAKDSLPSQLKDMPLPDPSVAKAMVTAVPPEIMQDPAKLQDAASSIADGNPPAWIKKLPDGAQGYFSELEEWAQSKGGASKLTGGADDSDSDDSNSDDSGSDASETGASGSDASESGASGSDASGSDDSGSDDSDSTAAEAASSTGGAPGPTGAVAASLAGAVGILGLAIAL